jgi:hypothetical protein
MRPGSKIRTTDTETGATSVPRRPATVSLGTDVSPNDDRAGRLSPGGLLTLTGSAR